MSEDNVQEPEEMMDAPESLPKVSEIDSLRTRAKQMGLKFHHKAGVTKLKKIIKEAMEGTKAEPKEVIATPKRGRKIVNRQNEKRKEAAKLIRVRVNCMNPNKRDWEGEIFTVANSVAGTFKKYVPFNNDDGWHIPNIIYQHMLERQCQIFQKKRNDRGVLVSRGRLINEFAIEVLPPLTKTELKTLAVKQAMAKGQED